MTDANAADWTLYSMVREVQKYRHEHRITELSITSIVAAVLAIQADEAAPMTREERRAAAIERGAAALRGVPYYMKRDRPVEAAAAVLDASGLLDDDDPPPAPIQADPAWLDSEFSGKGRKRARGLLDDDYEQVEFVVPHDHELCDGCLEHRTEPLFRKVSNTGEPK